MNDRDRDNRADRPSRSSNHSARSGEQRRDSGHSYDRNSNRDTGGGSYDRKPRSEGDHRSSDRAPRRDDSRSYDRAPRGDDSRGYDRAPHRNGDGYKPRSQGDGGRGFDRNSNRDGSRPYDRNSNRDDARSYDRDSRGGAGSYERKPRQDGERSYDRKPRTEGDRSFDRGPRRDDNRGYDRTPRRDDNRGYDRAPRRDGEGYKPRSQGDGGRGFDRNSNREGARSYDRDSRGGAGSYERKPRQDGERSYDRKPRQGGETGYNRSPRSDDRGYDRKPRQDGERSFDRKPRQDGERSYDRGPRRNDDRGNDRAPRRDSDRPQFGRGGTRGGGKSDRGGQGREFTEAERLQHELRPVRVEHFDPFIPDDVTPSDLHASARNELKTLQPETADRVAQHLAMVGTLIHEDPELAHQHAISASRRAGRIPVARETLAVTAYHTGDFALALRELRTYRRLTGSQGHLALMIECERALGRPERGIETGLAADLTGLNAEQRVQLAIAMSGARHDLGQNQQALFELEIPELDPSRAFSWSPELFAAYANVLEDLGREEESAKWHARALIAAEAIDEHLGAHDEMEIIEIYEHAPKHVEQFSDDGDRDAEHGGDEHGGDDYDGEERRDDEPRDDQPVDEEESGDADRIEADHELDQGVEVDTDDLDEAVAEAAVVEEDSAHKGE